MAALISRNTDLKSLRYGKDRVGGGNSNQPYIKSPIPENRNQLDRSGGIDFLLRGGTLTPSRAAKDVSRLTKMFGDFKSPNGALFFAKQNILSLSGVKTQASGIMNQGAYLPTSTILQVAGNAFGIHLNKQGLDPTKGTGPNAGGNSLFNLLGLRDPLGLPVYIENLDRNTSGGYFLKSDLDQEKYKKIIIGLMKLAERHNESDDVELLKSHFEEDLILHQKMTKVINDNLKLINNELKKISIKALYPQALFLMHLII